MKIDATYSPEFESLKELLMDMAQERSVKVLLDLIVTRMILRPHVALVRIWLTRKGDCNDCSSAQDCSMATLGMEKKCLHLVAGAGKSVSSPAHDWSDLKGHGRRVPLGITCVGKVAKKGRSLTSREIESDPDWQGRELWAKGEGILGFGAQPLKFKDEEFGVVAIYSRIQAKSIQEGRFLLKMIANHTGLSIANARALNQIGHLKSQLELENKYLKEEINDARAFGEIVGQSPALANTLNQIELVAPTDASVFIFGESGTGKELVAREIHKRSLRRDYPMIKVNCATIPGELYESEFFGHVKGAFTGAVKDRAGRFQAADKGTLFLDEIGELPVALQGKLLRILQEGTYERIGEDHTRQVNVRIIAATNRDIKEEVARGRFRRDLYYRLNVFPVEVVPLRSRKEDIPLLVRHFTDQVAAQMNRKSLTIRPADLKRLEAYGWPGNIRELRNVIERSIITSSGPALEFVFPDKTDPVIPPGQDNFDKQSRVLLYTDSEMEGVIKKNIINVLGQTRGKIYGPGGAAAVLGCAPTTLCSRIKKYQINLHSFKGPISHEP